MVWPLLVSSGWLLTDTYTYRSPGGPPLRPTLPSFATRSRVPSSTPPGIVREILLDFRTRPSPPQVLQGVRVSPVPPHAGQVCIHVNVVIMLQHHQPVSLQHIRLPDIHACGSQAGVGGDDVFKIYRQVLAGNGKHTMIQTDEHAQQCRTCICWNVPKGVCITDTTLPDPLHSAQVVDLVPG